MSKNPIEEAVILVGGLSAAGRICGVSYKAVSKWVKNGKLPRTEATGETCYADKLASRHPDIDKKALLETVMQDSAA